MDNKDPMERLLERLRVESLEGIILNTHTDLIENLKIASENIRKIIQDKDFWFLARYYVNMDYANTQLKLLSQNYKMGKRVVAEGKIKDVENYLISLPPGKFDSRVVARDLKITPRSMGNYLRNHKDELNIKKGEKQYQWEKY